MYGIPKTHLGGIPLRDRSNQLTDSAWRYWKLRLPAVKFAWSSHRIKSIRAANSIYTPAGRPWREYDIDIDASALTRSATFFWLGDSNYSRPEWANFLDVGYAHQVYLSGIELRESWNGENLFLDNRIKVSGSTHPASFWDILRTYYGTSLPYGSKHMRYRIHQANGGTEIVFDLKKRKRIRVAGLCSSFLWQGFEVYASNDKNNWVLLLEKSPQQFIIDMPHMAGHMTKPWAYDLYTGEPGVAEYDPAGYRYWGFSLVSSIRHSPLGYGAGDYSAEQAKFSMGLSPYPGGEGAWRGAFCGELFEYASSDYSYWNVNRMLQYVPDNMSNYGTYDVTTQPDTGWVSGQPIVFDYGGKVMFNYAQFSSAGVWSQAYVIASDDKLRWKAVKEIPFGSNVGKWLPLWD